MRGKEGLFGAICLSLVMVGTSCVTNVMETELEPCDLPTKQEIQDIRRLAGFCDVEEKDGGTCIFRGAVTQNQRMERYCLSVWELRE